MKKTFHLTHKTTKTDRLFEAARHEIKKYLRRERRKKLPEGADYWDFDCRFGPTEEESKAVHVADLTACISDIQARQLTSFYVEIIAKGGRRLKTQDSEEAAAVHPTRDEAASVMDPYRK